MKRSSGYESIERSTYPPDTLALPRRTEHSCDKRCAAEGHEPEQLLECHAAKAQTPSTIDKGMLGQLPLREMCTPNTVSNGSARGGAGGKEASSCAHDAKLEEDGAYDATALENNVSKACSHSAEQLKS
jgi:hypothetical protein